MKRARGALCGFLLGVAGLGGWAAADDESAEAVARLGDPDAGRRRLAQEEILRRGPESVPLLLHALASEDVETRRFAARALPLALERSSKPDRLDVIRRIAGAGSAAAGILPALERIAAEEAGEIRYAAMAASMRVGEHARHLGACAEGALRGKAGALAALRAVRPDDAGRLVQALRIRGTAPEDPASLDCFPAIASRDGRASALLASGLAAATPANLPDWADLLAMERDPSPEVAAAVAARLLRAGPREEALLLAALLRANAVPSSPALLAALQQRLPLSPRPSDLFCALLLARAGATPANGSGPLPATLLRRAGPELENALGRLPATERAELVEALADTPASELLPHLRWFLGSGEPGERQRLLHALASRDPSPELWPDLEALGGMGAPVRECVQRVLIAGAWDPELRDPTALRIFVSALSDRRSEVRQAAIFRCEALARIPPEVGAALGELLWHPGARPTLYFALNRCARLEREGRGLTPLLLRVLAEEPQESAGWAPNDVREWRRLAIKVLLKVESATPRSMPTLLRCLRSEDPVLREGALSGLLEAGLLDAETRAALQPLLSDPKSDIREAAARLLAASG